MRASLGWQLSKDVVPNACAPPMPVKFDNGYRRRKGYRQIEKGGKAHYCVVWGLFLFVIVSKGVVLLLTVVGVETAKTCATH